jgi:hypothetical protein
MSVITPSAARNRHPGAPARHSALSSRRRRDAVRLFEHGRGRVEADDTLDAFRQRASHSSGATREVGRSVVRLRLRCIDDERDDIFGVEFWSGGEATCLPAETGLGSRVRARLCFRGSLDVPFPEGV